jgi:hypothetical protein
MMADLRRLRSTVKQVPRPIFENSPVFTTMFGLPQSHNEETDGSSAERSLYLKGAQLPALIWFARAADAW